LVRVRSEYLRVYTAHFIGTLQAYEKAVFFCLTSILEELW
jgi:hypothetical protein